MVYLDLSDSDRSAYLDTLGSSHKIDVRLWLYDASEAFLGPLDLAMTDGQVDGTQANSIKRVLTITAQATKFSFTPDGDIFADKFVGCEYGVYVPTVGWVWDWVFKGPVTKYTRDTDTHTIECSSKEVLMYPPVQMPTLSNPGSKQVADYIRSAAEDFGEQFFDLGDAGSALVPKLFNIAPIKAKTSGVFWYLVQLAAKANYDLYYTRAGYLKLQKRDPASGPVYTFENLLTEPTSEFDITTVVNRVNVYGKDKYGHDVLKGFAYLPASHPLSQQSLARNGKDRVLVQEIHSTAVNMTTEEANTQANNALTAAIAQQVDVTFDSLPVPILELGDPCRVVSGLIDYNFTLTSYSLPLGPATMSVGYLTPKPVAGWTAVKKKVG